MKPSNLESENVLIFMAAYNEDKCIGQVIQEINNLPIKYTLLVIDDGSTDETRNIAEKMGVIVKQHSKNMGGASAAKTGLKFALENKFDYAIKLDADGQHMPKYIPLYLEKLISGQADWINGSRYLKRIKNEKNIKYIGRMFYSFIISKLCGKKITDVTNGFRGYNSKAIKLLTHTYPEGRNNAIEETIIAAKNLNILELNIEVKKRRYGKSKTFTTFGLLLYPPLMIKAIIMGYLKAKSNSC